MDDREQESVKRVAELPLVIINMLVNLIVTAALSLSIYLLMVNMFLTVYKFNMSGESSMQDVGGMSYQSVTPPLPVPKYYDCSTSNLLSVDECDLLNSYHARFLHSLGANLIDETQRGDLDATGNKPSLDSLKINTSLYVS